MKGLWIPYNILLVKKVLIGAKTLRNFLKFAIQYLTLMHRKRKSIYVGIINLFMTKVYSKAIMQRTRFRNKFLKNPNDQNKLLYNKQRNYCVSLLRKEKKEYFAR